MFKYLNIALIVFITLLFIETSINFLGRLYLLGNNFKAAKTCLSIVRDKELLGLIFYKQDKFEEAYKYYKKMNDWRGMGWAYYGMGKYDEAQDYFNRVNNYSGLGQVKLAQGKIEEAKTQFEKDQDHYGIGLTYLVEGDFINSKEEFVKTKNNLGYGLTFLVKGDFNSAKKIFSETHNKIVKGLLHVINKNIEEAKKIFEKIDNYTLLASFYKLIGDYHKAADVYKKNDNIKQLIKTYIIMGDIDKAFVLLKKDEYDYGFALLYYKLGAYEKAFYHFKKAKSYDESISALIMSGNVDQAYKYYKKLSAANLASNKLKYYMAEALIIGNRGKDAHDIINDLKKNESMMPKALLLAERIRLLNKNSKSLQRNLQEAINLSGHGFLADLIMKAASMKELSINAPKQGKIENFVPINPLKFIKLLFAFIILVIIFIVSLFFLKKKLDKAPETEDVQYGFSGVSDVHKIIYSDKSNLNASTVLKIKNRKLKKESKKSAAVESQDVTLEKPTLVKEEIKVQPDRKMDKLKKSGAQILQLALKEININSSAFELIELAGENADKLSVYGIYLAAKSKGAQVQGIKVDIQYFKDHKDNIHLVFFQDESFALLKSIDDKEVVAILGIDEEVTMPLSEFKEKWNGYVMSITKG